MVHATHAFLGAPLGQPAVEGVDLRDLGGLDAGTPGVAIRRDCARSAVAQAGGKTTVKRTVLPGVDVTVLYFDGCPNWQVADERLREALKLAGRDDVRVEHRLISTPEEAEALGFRGSPTVLVNGQDPFADSAAPAGLSCRVFRTEAGLAGSPTVGQLLAALS